jgi:hypothetical protein
MALRPIRIDRTSKPPMGTPLRSDGHWSLQGLVGAWAFNEGAGSVVYDGTRPSVIPVTATWETSGLKYPPSGITDTGLLHITGGATSQWSIVLQCRSDNGSANDTLLSTGAELGGTILLSKGVNLLIVFRGVATWDTGIAWKTDEPVVLTKLGTVYTCYHNGYVATQTRNTALSGTLKIGNQGSLYTPGSTKRYQFLQTFSRALSAFEIASLSENPWQIYEPETVWVSSAGGATGGTFSIPSVTLQPTVSAPSLSGAQSGLFSIPAVSLQPQVAAPSLAGAQAGSFVSVALQPVVSSPSLTGAQAGSFAIPAVTLQPVVSAPVLTGVVGESSGSFSIPSVTLQPIVTAPNLAAASANSIRAPNGTVLDLRDIHGNILDLRYLA